MIAECIYSQVDSEGNQYALLDQIIDHKTTPDCIPEEELYQVHSKGNIHKRQPMKGWLLCIQWKDGSTSWEHLKDMKHSYPIQVTKYAISRGIQDKLAFCWWVPTTIKNQACLIKAMRTRYTKRTHKYGICLPKYTNKAYDID